MSPSAASFATHPDRHRPRPSLRAITAAVIGLASLAAIGSPVEAGRARPKPALPAPAAPVIADVVANDATQARFRVTNPFESGVDTLVTSVSGPCAPGTIHPSCPTGFVTVVGDGYINGMLPDSTYTVTVRRHRFYDTNTNRSANLLSAPTTFTIRTLTLEAARPSAPVISRAGTSVISGRTWALVNWAPSADNTSTVTQIRYVYRIAEDATGRDVATCGSYCFGTTGATIPLPAPGTSITVTVTAIDDNGNRSLPSNPLVITG